MAVKVWIREVGVDENGEVKLEYVPQSVSPNRPSGEGWLDGETTDEHFEYLMESGKIDKSYYKPVARSVGLKKKIDWYVSARQLRLALNRLGLRDIVENYVKAGGWDLIDWWEYSTMIDRWHPIVEEALRNLNISDEQANYVWKLAETL